MTASVPLHCLESPRRRKAWEISCSSEKLFANISIKPICMHSRPKLGWFPLISKFLMKWEGAHSIWWWVDGNERLDSLMTLFTFCLVLVPVQIYKGMQSVGSRDARKILLKRKGSINQSKLILTALEVDLTLDNKMTLNKILPWEPNDLTGKGWAAVAAG